MDVFDRHDTQNLQGMRETLKALEAEVGRRAWDQRDSLEPHDWRSIGRLIHCINVAEEAVFDILNCGASYCGDQASKEALR